MKEKKGFEGKFIRDQDLEFKILARRNKYLGVWAAERLNHWRCSRSVLQGSNKSRYGRGRRHGCIS